jgi:hypothetical protein
MSPRLYVTNQSPVKAGSYVSYALGSGQSALLTLTLVARTLRSAVGEARSFGGRFATRPRAGRALGDLSPFPVFTRDDLAVYERVLFEIHGPHGREITLDVGYTARDLYDAIASRANARMSEVGPDDAWTPDEIDLAAIRVVGCAVLRRCYEPEFGTTSGYTFSDVKALHAKAAAMVRTRVSGAGSTTIRVGDHRIQFPTRSVRQAGPGSKLLVAVPTATGWPRVYTHIRDASALRQETIATLQQHRYPRDEIEEFEADSYLDLEQLATIRAAELSRSRATASDD